MAKYQTYTVKKGDSYFRIAGELFGDQRFGSALAGANYDKMLHPGMEIRIPRFDTDITPTITQKRMETLASAPQFTPREGDLAKVLAQGAEMGWTTGEGVVGPMPDATDIEAPTPAEYLQQFGEGQASFLSTQLAMGLGTPQFPGLGTGGMQPGTTADVPGVTPLEVFAPTRVGQGYALDLGTTGELPPTAQQTMMPGQLGFQEWQQRERAVTPTDTRPHSQVEYFDPITGEPMGPYTPPPTPALDTAVKQRARATGDFGKAVDIDMLNMARQFYQGLRVFNETLDRTAMPLYMNDEAVDRYLGHAIEDREAYMSDLGYRNIGGIWMRYDPMDDVLATAGGGGYYPSSGGYSPSRGGGNYVSRGGRTLGYGGTSNVSRQMINWRIGFG